MGLGVYINFLNESQEAIAFYEQVFDVKCTDLMTFELMGHPGGDQYKHLVLNGSLDIHGAKVLISDVEGVDQVKLIPGNNISIVINYDDLELMKKEFAAISVDGNVTMPLGQTFWAKQYGMVYDKFGVGWQFNLGIG